MGSTKYTYVGDVYSYGRQKGVVRLRGRKKTLHDPVKTSMRLERSDLEAAKSSGMDDTAIFRAGLKHCILTGRPRSDVLTKLIKSEVEMAEEHEAEALAHRHRAEQFEEKLKGILNQSP